MLYSNVLSLNNWAKLVVMCSQAIVWQVRLYTFYYNATQHFQHVRFTEPPSLCRKTPLMQTFRDTSVVVGFLLADGMVTKRVSTKLALLRAIRTKRVQPSCFWRIREGLHVFIPQQAWVQCSVLHRRRTSAPRSWHVSSLLHFRLSSCSAPLQGAT